MPQQLLEVIPQREARNRSKRAIEDTFTNKSAMIIEDTLRTWLQRVVNEIRDEFDDNPEGYRQPEVYSLVRREVGDGLRQATEAFYRLAIEYVNRVNQTNAFFTTRDADNVKTIANDNTGWILHKFDDYFRREADIKRNEKLAEPMTKLMAQLEKKSHSPLVISDSDTMINAVKKLNSFNIDSNITSIATITSTRAINFGTIDKTIQMAEVPLESIVVSKSAAKMLELGLDSQQIIDAGFTPAEYVPRSMFVTKKGDVRKRSLFKTRDIQTYGYYITSRDDKLSRYRLVRTIDLDVMENEDRNNVGSFII